MTYSNYDADAGYLLKLLRWKNLASQQQIQRATMVYKSLHSLAPDYLYVLNLKDEKLRITYGTLRISLMFLCRAQTITKVAFVIVAPLFGTDFLVT